MKKQETNQIDILESQLLSKFNEGYKTFDDLSNQIQFSDNTLLNVLNNLISKGLMKLNINTKEYEYVTPLKDETIILDGNFMLPTTIITTEKHILISRGEWYKFPLDFDVRRIIWNVVLPDEKNSTLVNLIKESAIKAKKSKNDQVPEYKNLVGYLIPWNDEVKFEILVVGSDITDISIIFIDKLYLSKESKTDFIEFRSFQIKTEIDTQDLIKVLTTPIESRNYTDIKLNRMYNFSELIYKNNCIPYKNDGNTIEFVKISGVRNQIQLTYLSMDRSSKEKKVNEEIYTDISEGIEVLKSKFLGYAEKMLAKNDFLIEND